MGAKIRKKIIQTNNLPKNEIFQTNNLLKNEIFQTNNSSKNEIFQRNNVFGRDELKKFEFVCTIQTFFCIFAFR